MAYVFKFFITLCGQCERRLFTEKKAFYCSSMSASVQEICAFRVLEILRKNAKRKLSILCPFTKIVTSQVGFVFIQYLNVPCNSDIICQNQVKLATLIKQDEKILTMKI